MERVTYLRVTVTQPLHNPTQRHRCVRVAFAQGLYTEKSHTSQCFSYYMRALSEISCCFASLKQFSAKRGINNMQL